MRYEFSTVALLNGFSQVSIKAPLLQESAKPGQYIFIDDRFPCYIMGNSPDLEIIASPELVAYLSNKEDLQLSSLQGSVLTPPTESFTLMTVQDDALSAIIFYLKKFRKQFNGLVFIGATNNFPFAPCPSRLLITHLPKHVIAALPLFEDWGVPNRLASQFDTPGVYHGDVSALAKIWLDKTENVVVQNIILPAL